MRRPERDPLAFLRVRDLEWVDLVVPPGTLEALRSLAVAAPRGGLVAVVSGPSGVGKTVAVQALAEQLRLDTWRLDCRLLVELRGRVSGAALPDLVAVAERPHALLLAHDAEWLFQPVAGGAGRRLLELAGGRLPPTVLESREPELFLPCTAGCQHVAVPFPDRAARHELWRRLAWRAHPLARLDLERLAEIAVSGAEIERALAQVVEDAGGGEPDTERLLAALRGAR